MRPWSRKGEAVSAAATVTAQRSKNLFQQQQLITPCLQVLFLM
jgi:hypothetical protein